LTRWWWKKRLMQSEKWAIIRCCIKINTIAVTQYSLSATR
jgi:hypothetical protein